MKHSMLESAGHGTGKWSIEKPAQTVPEITEEFILEGTRMYRTKDGKEYIADRYDENFTFAKGTVIAEKRMLQHRSMSR